MRWLPFAILSYLIVSLQFALGGILQLGEYTPSLVLLFLIFIGLHAPLDAALIGGFTLGFMHDVVSAHGIGTYALAYSLIAGLTFQLRSIMYADHVATHFTITIILGVLLVGYLVFRHWMRSFYFAGEASIQVWPQIVAVFVAAVIAIPAIYGLRRIRRVFAFSNK